MRLRCFNVILSVWFFFQSWITVDRFCNKNYASVKIEGPIRTNFLNNRCWCEHWAFEIRIKWNYWLMNQQIYSTERRGFHIPCRTLSNQSWGSIVIALFVARWRSYFAHSTIINRSRCNMCQIHLKHTYTLTHMHEKCQLVYIRCCVWKYSVN